MKKNHDIYNGNCLYCGKKIVKEESTAIFNKTISLYVCSNDECKIKAKNFLARDQKYRKLMYVLVGITIFPLMFMYILKVSSHFTYVMLLAACTLLFLFPFPFSNYQSYQYCGIRKTIKAFYIILAVTMIISIANLAL